MQTVLAEYITEEKRSVVRFTFHGQKDSMQKILIKKYFLFMVGNVCRVKRFTTCGKYFSNDEEIKTEVLK
jgi:hypothetical protein